MGFGDWNSGSWGGESGFEGGFNAEDYMTDIDNMIEQSGGKLGKGFAQGLFTDLQNQQQSWGQAMQSATDAWRGTQEYGERDRELYDEKMSTLHELQDERLAAAEAGGAERLDIAKGYTAQVEDWSRGARKTFSEGMDKVRGMADESLAKVKEVEAEFKDFTTQALSAQVAGTSDRYAMQKQQGIDAARRAGAPPQALEQMAMRMDSEMGQVLQGQVAQSAGQFQTQLSQMGLTTAQAMASRAATESQITSGQFQTERIIGGVEMDAWSKEAQVQMQTSETIQNIKTGFAEQKMAEASAFEQRQLRGEQLKIEGNSAYAQMIMNNPPVGVADVWATMITQASMPGAGKMGTWMLPGMRQEKLDAKRRSLSLQYPNEDFSTMSASQLNEWEQMNKEHGGNWKYGSRVRYRDPGSGGY
tara:strand:+ start:9132 stop:10379 length:1248 start_codon:yes stop_codon:yes gene_type:complete